MLFGMVFCCLCNGVFYLLIWLVSSDFRLFKLYCMSGRVVLCFRGPECSDWCVRGRLILGRIFYGLLKLCIGNICAVRIFYELLQLSCGILSVLHRLDCLYSMSCWIILRNNGSHRCDGSLFFGVVFCFLCNGVH